MKKYIEPMTMGNASFAVHLLGADMPPAQFVRELTQNSIEAIQRLETPNGKILWGPWKHDKYNKLSIVDTGIGMTKDELKEFINQMFSSSGVQSLSGNFGVGGKISAITRSPIGVTYNTLKNGVANSATLEFEFENGNPISVGFSCVELPDGTKDSVREIGLENLPKPILEAGHGTEIILWGSSIEENSNLPPSGLGTTSARWLTKLLNNTYWEFPPNIEIRAYEKEYASSPRPDGRAVYGQKYFLNHKDAVESKGLVQLSNATAYWWIYKKDSHTGYNDIANVHGYVAALYQNELYEMATDKSKRNRMINFGLTLAKTEGFSRVTIIVKPQVSPSRISANVVRKSLILDGRSLPWDEWAEEFSNKLPPELKKLIEDSIDETNNEELPCQERIKKYLKLFERTQYKQKDNGNLSLSPDFNSGNILSSPTIDRPDSGKDNFDGSKSDGELSPGSSNEDKPKRNQSKKKTNPAEVIGSIYNNSNQKNAVRSNYPSIPVARWVSVFNGSRDLDEMEDFAAEYFMSQNLIRINEDFRLFCNDLEYWCKELQIIDVPRKQIVHQVIKDRYQQVLMEAVMGALSLSSSDCWSNDKIEEALSSYTLTVVVTARSHIHDSIKRELYTKFGKQNKTDNIP